MSKRYPSVAINQTRANDGRVYPMAPAGMAEPKGWRLTPDGEGYEREPKEPKGS
jgi:hypothetical protein